MLINSALLGATKIPSQGQGEIEDLFLHPILVLNSGLIFQFGKVFEPLIWKPLQEEKTVITTSMLYLCE